MTVRPGPSNATRLPFADGCRPSPASMMPALTSFSLYLPMASSSSVEGIRPASLSFVAFTRTMTRIASSPLLDGGHERPPRWNDERASAGSTRSPTLFFVVGDPKTESPRLPCARSRRRLMLVPAASNAVEGESHGQEERCRRRLSGDRRHRHEQDLVGGRG